VQDDSWHGDRSETIPQLGIIFPDVKWSRFQPSRLSRMLAGAIPERPIHVPIHRFGSSPPPRTTGSIKGRVAGLFERSPSAGGFPFLLIAPGSRRLVLLSVWPGIDNPPIRLLTPHSSPT